MSEVSCTCYTMVRHIHKNRLTKRVAQTIQIAVAAR